MGDIAGGINGPLGRKSACSHNASVHPDYGLRAAWWSQARLAARRGGCAAGKGSSCRRASCLPMRRTELLLHKYLSSE